MEANSFGIFQIFIHLTRMFIICRPGNDTCEYSVKLKENRYYRLTGDSGPDKPIDRLTQVVDKC